jgi:hypothetical protein
MSLQYTGRANAPDVGVGNKCFLFFTSYIYAKLNNLKIEASGDRNPHQKVNKLIKTKSCKDIWFKKGDHRHDKKVIVKTSMYKDGILTYPGELNAVFDGYFHDSRYITENYELINNILDLDHYRKPALEKMNYDIGPNDVLCHLRLGEFVGGNNVLHPDYFLNIFEDNNYDTIYFLATPTNDKHIEKYFSYFEKYKEKIVIVNHEAEHEDFYFPHLFKNIIVSNSTFNWWSTFLNSRDPSSKIHLPLDNKKIHFNKMNDSCKQYPAKYISHAELKEL